MRHLYIAGRILASKVIEVQAWPLDSLAEATENAAAGLEMMMKAGEWPTGYRQLQPTEADSFADLMAEHPDFSPDGWSLHLATTIDPDAHVALRYLDPLTEEPRDLFLCIHGNVHTDDEVRRPNRRERRHPRSSPRRP